MKDCDYEISANVLTYAVKNLGNSFSQKEFKNVVYTKEFKNYDINAKIQEAFSYLLNIGLIELERQDMTYFERYNFPRIIKINTQNITKVYRALSKKIIHLHESEKQLYGEEVFSNFFDIAKAINIIKQKFFLEKDVIMLQILLTQILVNKKVSNSLLCIIQFLNLESSVNIVIKNEILNLQALDVKFELLEFYDDFFVLHFDKCSFRLNSLKDILSITSSNFVNKHEILDSLKKYEEEEAKELVLFLKNLDF